jgi:hypothetical protein
MDGSLREENECGGGMFGPRFNRRSTYTDLIFCARGLYMGFLEYFVSYNVFINEEIAYVRGSILKKPSRHSRLINKLDPD